MSKMKRHNFSVFYFIFIFIYKNKKHKKEPVKTSMPQKPSEKSPEMPTSTISCQRLSKALGLTIRDYIFCHGNLFLQNFFFKYYLFINFNPFRELVFINQFNQYLIFINQNIFHPPLFFLFFLEFNDLFGNAICIFQKYVQVKKCVKIRVMLFKH